MPIFKNIFNCSSKDDTKDDEIREEIHEIKSELQQIKKDVAILFHYNNDTRNDIRRLEEKISNKFDMLNMKIDNLIMITNTRKID